MNAAAQANVLAPRPDHVPAEMVVDFDCLAPPGWERDVHLAWYRVRQEGPPIFWTPRNGGHWVVTRGSYIRRMQVDCGLFSHKKYTIPYAPEAADAPPASSDPPLHGAYRALIAPALMPAQVRALEADIRAVTRETIATFADKGGCEFIADFAQVVPITMFLRLVDIPLDDRTHLLSLAHRAARPRDLADRIGAVVETSAYLESHLAERRREPRDDMLSTVANGMVGNRPITGDEALRVSRTLMFGGLDTVASMQGYFAHFLAGDEAARAFLGAHPDRIADAVEELIRRFGVANSARSLSRDTVFEGVQFLAGDQVLLPNSLVGLDDELNPRPLEVDFDREPSGRPLGRRHAAFGSGAHACPGAGLARLEMRIFLEEWLARIPDFGIDPMRPPVLATGFINGVSSLHLVWD